MSSVKKLGLASFNNVIVMDLIIGFTNVLDSLFEKYNVFWYLELGRGSRQISRKVSVVMGGNGGVKEKRKSAGIEL